MSFTLRPGDELNHNGIQYHDVGATSDGYVFENRETHRLVIRSPKDIVNSWLVGNLYLRRQYVHLESSAHSTSNMDRCEMDRYVFESQKEEHLLSLTPDEILRE
jgi:hypothetical protein